MSVDFINGIYECIGGFMMLLNCHKIWKDKKVSGISLWAMLFFTSWGYWNLYYYPSLNQWLSFVGGVILVLGNTVWMTLSFYYTYKNRVE